MKIRKSLLVSASLLMISPLVLSSCESESIPTDINKEKTPTTAVESALRSITFNIALPGGEPVTYAPIHDAEEYAISGMTIYMYDASGNRIYSTSLLGSELSGSGPAYTVTKRIQVPGTGQYRFRVVANENMNSYLTYNYSALNNVNASKSQADKGSCSQLLNGNTIPMTGETNLMDLSSANTINIALTRIVARIDVVNNVPGFTIDELRLSNTAPSSSLFPGRYLTNPLVSNVTPYRMNATPVQGTSSMQYKKAFYLYEKQNTADNNVTKVLVKGHDDHNRIFLYTVPFKKNGSFTHVDRNRLYRIQIGDGVTPADPDNANELAFNIAVSDWTPMDVNRDYSVVDVTFGSGSGTYNPATRTFTTNSAQLTDASFTISDLFAAGSTYSISYSAGSNSWLQAQVSGTTLNVSTLNANTTGSAREGVITLTSNHDSTTKCEIKVIQLAN